MKLQEIKVIAEITDAKGETKSTIIDVMILEGFHHSESVMNLLNRNHPNCIISIKDVQWVLKKDN